MLLILIMLINVSFALCNNSIDIKSYKQYLDIKTEDIKDFKLQNTKAETSQGNLLNFNKNSTEDFTKETFNDLIEEQLKSGYEYLLAKVTSKSELGNKYSFFYDGNLFYKYFFGQEVILTTDHQINFYKLLSRYPLVTLKRLNELGLPLGLQKHNYIDNQSRCPIVAVEFYEIDATGRIIFLTELRRLLENETERLLFHLFLADNYPTLEVLLHTTNILIKKKLLYQKVIQYYEKALSLTDDEEVINSIIGVLLVLEPKRSVEFALL